MEEALSELILMIKKKIEAEEKFLKFVVTRVAKREKKEERERGIRYVGFKEGRIHAMRQILKALEAIEEETDLEKASAE